MNNIIQLMLSSKTISYQPTVNATVGCCLGDSTVAAYAGGTAIATLLFDQPDIDRGYACTSLAVPGNTINQQLAAWNAFANKASMDWIVVQIGLNDLNPADSLSAALGRYQTLIDTINSTKKVDAKVLLATMIPCKQRLIDLYGSTNGLVSYQKWLDVNDAICGQGATPVTGGDFSVRQHTIALNDGSGNLKQIYDTGDHIHDNTAAREINATVWRDSLRHLLLYSTY